MPPTQTPLENCHEVWHLHFEKEWEILERIQKNSDKSHEQIRKRTSVENSLGNSFFSLYRGEGARRSLWSDHANLLS